MRKYNKIFFENDNLYKLAKASYEMSLDSNLIQGAGGNTSLKEGNKLWIKASGKRLSDALSKEIFVDLDLNEVNKLFHLAKDNFNFEFLEGTKLKPSIETFMHSLLPQRFILHSHSTDIISLSIRSNAEKIIKGLLGQIKFHFINYQVPGLKLAKEIKNANLKKEVDVYILQNHGLIIAGNDIEKALDLQKEVLKRVKQKIREVKKPNISKLVSEVKKLGKLRVPKNQIVHTLATDPINYQLLQNNPPCPDNVVFCGARPKFTDLASLNKYLTNEDFLYCAIKNEGIILLSKATSATEIMLEALAQIFLRIKKDESINFLSDQQCKELLNMDSEKFRLLTNNY
tara:strand:- start:477 stop:1505 length:1029 start_codon:yes stop_codon:yes gene_type:complete